MQASQKPMELFRLSQQGCWPGTAQSFAPIEAFQPSAELAAKDAAENLDREKERVTGAYPASVVRRDPARRNNAVNVRMQQEVLPPRVQNTDRADPGAEVPGIGGDFQ